MQERITTHFLLAFVLIFALLSLGVTSCGRSSSSGQASNTTAADSLAFMNESGVVERANSKNGKGEAHEGNDVASDEGNDRSVTANNAAVQLPSQRSSTQQTDSSALLDITFDDLKLEMPVGTLFDSTRLTPRVAELDGKEVRLRGFIFAGGVFQSSGIKNFPFVMNTQCKFGPQGFAYCVILVELKEGVTTNFTTYPITVEGKLTVRPFNANGFTWSVYHLRGNKVF